MKTLRGFTLVEILVVVIIVGLLAGMTVLAIGKDPQRMLKQEAQRAQAVLHLAVDEALLEGKEYGFLINKKGYQVLQFEENSFRWEPLSIPAFAHHSLPEDIHIDMESEGKTIDLVSLSKANTAQKIQTEDSLNPSLLLLSSGEITPFKMSFRSKNLSKIFILSSDGMTRIQLSSSGET